MSRASPTEFLAEIQRIYRVPFTKNTDPDPLLAEIERDLARVGLTRDQVEGHQEAVRRVVEIVEANLPERVRTGVWRRKLAIGPLDTPEVNALAATDGIVYAIVLGSGLMTFFHKYFKLTAATQCVGAITHCSRMDPEEVTPARLKEWTRELVAHYRNEGVPRGAIIRIDERRATPSYIATYMLGLSFVETFVLCHELGHILCGHLGNPDRLIPLKGHPDIRLFAEGGNKELELQADLFAFWLTRFIMKNQFGGMTEEEMLGQLVLMFDLLYEAGYRATSSHPSPLERGVYVTESVYGYSAAERLARSYTDSSVLASTFDNLVFREPGGMPFALP